MTLLKKPLRKKVDVLRLLIGTALVSVCVVALVSPSYLSCAARADEPWLTPIPSFYGNPPGSSGGGGGGGTVTGTGAANEVAYWTSATNITSEAAFGYDPATNIFTVDTLRGANGTAAAPTFSFSSGGNTDNGMYLSAGDTLGWSTGGTSRATMSTTVFAVTEPETITTGALTAGESGLTVTSTLATSGAAQYGTQILITGSGAGAGSQNSLFVNLAAGGYTGTSTTRAGYFNNVNLGGGALVAISDSGTANYGVMSLSLVTTNADRSAVGVFGYGAQAGNAANTARNFGVIGLADGTGAIPGALSVNLGVYGTAAGGADAIVRIGGMFSLYGETDTIGTLADAALIADNAAIAASIQLWRDSGTTVIQIADGGVMTGNVASDATADFRWHTDTNTSGIFLDVSAETIDFVGGSGSTGCSISAAGNLTCAGTISGSGTLTGTIANTQVAFGNGTAIAGDAAFTYVTGTNTLTVGGSSEDAAVLLNPGVGLTYTGSSSETMTLNSNGPVVITGAGNASFVSSANNVSISATSATGDVVIERNGGSDAFIADETETRVQMADSFFRVTDTGANGTFTIALDTTSRFVMDTNGHIASDAIGIGTVNTGTCTNEAATADSNDVRGEVETDCTAGQTTIITFGVAYSSTPFCTVSASNAAGGASVVAGTATTTTLTLTIIGTVTDGRFAWTCFQ